MDTRIYVMTHKRFAEPKTEAYIPLHVGREGKEALGYIGDNTGLHISGKNGSYCELTGIYWIWKNIVCDIAGLCHYRRYFVRNGSLLVQAEIEEILQEYDIILGNSSMSPQGSVYAHYCVQHYERDLLVCKEVIRRMEPDYLSAFELCMQSNLMNLGNMMIAPKKLFDSYCEWLFPLLEEIERQTDTGSYDAYQARLYGFLSERLLRVWVMMQPIRVREEEIAQIETAQQL